MTQFTGKEPQHWHTPSGRHNMTDPRSITGYPATGWTNDERAYVEHLRLHETGAPTIGDTERITELLALVRQLNQQHTAMVELLVSLVEQLRTQARMTEPDG